MLTYNQKRITRRIAEARVRMAKKALREAKRRLRESEFGAVVPLELETGVIELVENYILASDEEADVSELRTVVRKVKHHISLSREDVDVLMTVVEDTSDSCEEYGEYNEQLGEVKNWIDSLF